MPSTQLARGLWTDFANAENPFQVPNGMPENLRVIDDHIALHTLADPLAPGAALPAGAADGDGQIFSDGSYAVHNAGTWKTYGPCVGLLALRVGSAISWINRGDGWQEHSAAEVLEQDDGGNRVGYDPGGPNPVARKVQARLRERMSPRDKGALGNGTGDDAVAIARALTDGRSVHLVDGVYLATPSGSGAMVALAAHGAHITGPGTLKVRPGQYYKGTPGAEDNYGFLKLTGDGAVAVGFRFDGNGQATLEPYDANGPNVQFFPVLLYGTGAGQKAVLIDTVGSGGHAIEAFYGRRKIVALNTTEGHNGMVVNGVTAAILALSISENVTDSHFNFGHNETGVAIGLVGRGNKKNGGGIDIDGGNDIVFGMSAFRDGQSFGAWLRESAQTGQTLNRVLVNGVLLHNNCNFGSDDQAEAMLGNPFNFAAVPGVDWVVTGSFFIPLDTPVGAGYNAGSWIHPLLERLALHSNVFSGDLRTTAPRAFAFVHKGAKDVATVNNVSLKPSAEVYAPSAPRGFWAYCNNTNLRIAIDSPYVPTQMHSADAAWDFEITRKLPKSGMAFFVVNFLGGLCHDVIEIVLAGEGDTGVRRQTIVLRGAQGQQTSWLNETDASDNKAYGTAPPGVSVATGFSTAVIGGFANAAAPADNLVVGIRIKVTTPYDSVARFVPKFTY